MKRALDFTDGSEELPPAKVLCQRGMKRAFDSAEGSEELPHAKVLCQRDLYCDSMASSSSAFPIASSISSTSQWKYDVFLSFRGEDTRNTAVDIVNNALQWRGIYTFKDDEKLEKGKTIKPGLLKAIEESRFAVVILSKNYASSTWCLEELVKIIECEKEKGMTILPIFYDVDPSDLRKLKGAFANALNEHEKQFKEKVGTWRAALKHVADIDGYHIKNSPLSEAVKSIVRLVSHESCPEFSEITEGLVGIHSRLAELKSRLALWLKDDVRSIGIWAMGGMGKSTLAKVAYETISKEFDYCCFINEDRKKDLFSVQEYLISQILHVKDPNIQNELNGEHMIKKMLRDKKVLLVLDDVDESNKLRKLVKSDWFGLGSRIIITTRDEHLLRELSVDEIFEVKALNYKDSLCLFCSKAFKKEQCPDEYLEPMESFLEYVNGLPLALEVLGSFLFERSTAEWKGALKMLKEEPKLEINRVLKISFDRLPGFVKDIFKDIACFFNHEEEDHVVRKLDSIGRLCSIGLPILIEKSLLKISKKNKVWMHNLIEDMGRNEVRQESLEPGERSRLWLYEDIDHVLKNNTGTGNVQAIDIKGAKDTRIYHEEKEACWRPRGLAPLVALQEWVLSALSWQGFKSSKKPEGRPWIPNAFLKMRNLKFLRIRSICLQLYTLPNNLRYFEYIDYPFKSLPPLPDELVELHLPRSNIKQLWRGMKIFEKLKFIDMDGSSDLIITPNFNGVPYLKELVLARCSNLRELHPSIRKLKQLQIVDLEGCQELNILPNKFEMESLVFLNLTFCSKVKKIPEFGRNMKLLQELLLEGTAITELPSSVECLTGLYTLNLQDCKNLVCLPNTICSLRSLNNLYLSGCSKFDKLPENLGNIVSLEMLDLSGTAIKELPSSVEFLIGLTSLHLRDCKNLVCLPNTICSLRSLNNLYLSGCSKFDKLPENLGNIVSLEMLDLSGTAITELPSSIEFLTRLAKLYLDGCPKFVKLPKNLGNLKHLNWLCLEGTAIEVLPSSVECLAALEYLKLKDCKNLVCLPSTLCNLKRVVYLDLIGCSKIANLPENLGNMESLKYLLLGETAIKELPSSTIHLKFYKVSFKGCQLSSSSLTSMPRSYNIDLSDCNLSAIPSGIDCFSKTNLFLMGNDFVSLPGSISQFSRVTHLYLDGCKNLRSLSNFPAKVKFISVDNCTSLERLPELPNDFDSCDEAFIVQCFNCFKLVFNIQNFSNIFQGQGENQKIYVIPGREIPKWFEEVNICDTLGAGWYSNMRPVTKKKVKIQLPGSGSGSGCDEWRRIVLCVVLLPPKRHHSHQRALEVTSVGFPMSYSSYGSEIRAWLTFTAESFGEYKWSISMSENFGKVELHHLWLGSFPKEFFCLPEHCHQVELEIDASGMEVEKIGFRVV